MSVLKIISKRDNKQYYVCIAKFNTVIGFSEGEKYQVRKATPEDCADYENYCIVNGTFDESVNNIFIETANNLINKYQGTSCINKKVKIEDCKNVLSYINKY